jgi:galactose dehydrogenase
MFRYVEFSGERMAARDIRYGSLQDAAVLITGGASGIGAALVAAFAAQGAKTAFIDIDARGGNAVCETLRSSPHKPIFIEADLSSVADAQKAVMLAAKALGGIQVLINNAARDDRHDPLTITEQEWDESHAVNLKPVMFVTQAAIPYLEKASGASVINFSSIAYLLNMGEVPAYGAAKAAIVGLTKTLAGRLGASNIRVNALLPGMIVTERQKQLWLTEEGISAFQQKQCIKRVLLPEDLVGPCLFLASTASSAITAQAIIVDGGVF